MEEDYNCEDMDLDEDFILDLGVETLDMPSSSCSRFVPVREEDIQNDLRNRIPVGTQKKAKWAITILRNWHKEWKERLDGVNKVFKDIEEWTDNELNYCLRVFICEVRKVNGELYPPRSLKNLVAMIQWWFNNTLSRPISIFMDKAFHEARSVLDSQMKKGAALGMVKCKKKAVCITTDDEEAMWKNGAFGYSNPGQLLNTLIYHIGLHCSLRATQEHRDLEYGE